MKKLTILVLLLMFATFAISAEAQGPSPKNVVVVNDSSNAVPVVDYTNRLIATAASNKSEGYFPLGVNFSSSIVGGTGPIDIHWDFGDGNSATNPNPHHNYFDPGSYLVTLTAVDSLGLTAVSTLTIQVNVNGPPFARLVADRVVGIAPLKVNLDASTSYDSNGDRLWFTLYSGEFDSTNSPFLTYEYITPGTYTASVTVLDPGGMDDTDSVQITVEEDTFPVVSASIPLNVFVGETWDFIPTVTGGNQPLVYHWEFGDGSTSKISNTSHTYVHPGTYTATLTVTDANGDVGSYLSTVTVTVAP